MVNQTGGVTDRTLGITFSTEMFVAFCQATKHGSILNSISGKAPEPLYYHPHAAQQQQLDVAHAHPSHNWSCVSWRP